MREDLKEPNSARAILARSISDGLGVVVAILFWFLLTVFVILATAQSGKPWDTFIAALAMVSQAFFAFMVWRLGQAQYAFARQTAERQHAIDMYPLRIALLNRLRKVFDEIIDAHAVLDRQIEEIRQCHLEIKNVFSDQANDLAYQLYEASLIYASARNEHQPTYDFGGSIVVPETRGGLEAIKAARDEAWDIFTDLENTMDEEAKVRPLTVP